MKRYKIHIHPDYWMYRDFINAIPQDRYERTETFCQRRNTVERVQWGERDFVVKRFKRPTLANCVIYTWFRRTKARRAYEYAGELLKRGIETARPVAFIEERRNGFFHTGWFVSEYLPYPLMKQLGEMDLPEKEKRRIGREFITFTAQLHSQGILPKDYNTGNIFFHREGEHYRFALIDINRLRIGRTPDERESILFFDQLGVKVSTSVTAIDQYASLRGFDTDRCILFILLHRLRRHIEQTFKRRVLHPMRIRS